MPSFIPQLCLSFYILILFFFFRNLYSFPFFYILLTPLHNLSSTMFIGVFPCLLLPSWVFNLISLSPFSFCWLRLLLFLYTINLPPLVSIFIHSSNLVLFLLFSTPVTCYSVHGPFYSGSFPAVFHSYVVFLVVVFCFFFSFLPCPKCSFSVSSNVLSSLWYLCPQMEITSLNLKEWKWACWCPSNSL